MLLLLRDVRHESDSLEELSQRKLRIPHSAGPRDGAARVPRHRMWLGRAAKTAGKEHQVENAVGLTLSENPGCLDQIDGPHPELQFVSRAGPDHVSLAPYDSIISIGAF